MGGFRAVKFSIRGGATVSNGHSALLASGGWMDRQSQESLATLGRRRGSKKKLSTRTPPRPANAHDNSALAFSRSVSVRFTQCLVLWRSAMCHAGHAVQA